MPLASRQQGRAYGLGAGITCVDVRRNPVCIAAALATLDVIEKEGLLRNSQEVGDHMLKRMADWPKKHKIVGDVRGRA